MEDIEIVKVLYDYQAEDETCLTLSAGDIIYVINKDESGWYDGVLSSGPFKGKRAWFPSNFTKPIEKTVSASPVNHDIPIGWKQKISKDGSSYYYNLSTYQTVSSKEEIPKNPRQSLLLLKATSADFEELKDLSSLKEEEEHLASSELIKPTWDNLISFIFKGISNLNDSAKVEDKSKFLVHTSDVVKGVRHLLISCDCLSKSSLILKQNPQLRANHIQLLCAIAKLVLAAKIASGIYPQPKSTTKMRYQAGQVLLAVRHFTTSAQEKQVQLSAIVNDDAEIGLDVSKIPMSDFELVKKLDIFSNNVLTTATEMISVLFQSNTDFKAISTSKAIVYEVGQIFSLIDELKLGGIRNKEMDSLVEDFKNKREVLYERVNDLVSTTSVLLDSFAPADSQQMLQKCCSSLMRASEDVIVATKVLIDKKEDYEQQILEQEIQNISDPKRDSDLVLLQRRAMSLTYLPNDVSELNLLKKTVSQELIDKTEQLDATLRGRSSTSRIEYSKDNENIALKANENRFLKSKNTNNAAAFLSYDYNPNDLILNMDNQISGGTLVCLVERLTLHDVTIDPQYLTSFLQTFRLFTTQLEFLKLLKLRFLIEEPKNLTAEEVQIWRDKKLTPIRLRVFNVLKTWIETYFYEEDEAYIENLDEFANQIIRPYLPSMAIRLLDTLKKRNEKEFQDKLSFGSYPRSPKSTKSFRLKNTSIVQLDYTDVAKQITLMETEMFVGLKPEDLIAYVFQRNRNTKVSDITKFSTNLSSLVAETILEEEDLKKRAQNLKFWIKCAGKLKEYKNYNGLMTVLSALNSSSIRRLKKTWVTIQNKHLQSFEELEQITDHKKNFSEYRKEMKTAVPPFLPFLGIFLTDLTFSKDGNPDYKDADCQIINYTKYFRISLIIQELQRFQNPYEFKIQMELRDLLSISMSLGFLKYGGSVENMYERSIFLEPKLPSKFS